MTIANKITLSRIALIPVALILLFVPGLQTEIRGFFQITIAQLVFSMQYLDSIFQQAPSYPILPMQQRHRPV